MKPKIIIINILIILASLIFLDYIQYKLLIKDYFKTHNSDFVNVCPIMPYYKYFSNVYSNNTLQGLKKYYRNGQWSYLRHSVNETTDKPSVIIFGCSFAHGSFLNEEQTLSYKLSQATGRSVYNYAVEAGGFAQMLYFLRDDNFYNQIKNPPEYVIYVYISNHLERLTSNMSNPLWLIGYNLQYKLKNNDLVIKQDLPGNLYKPFIVKKLYTYFDKKNNEHNKEVMYKRFAILNEILLESKNRIQEHYPDTKFVIIDYNYDYNYEKEYNNIPFMWSVLKDEGFIVLHTKDLVGREFNQSETEKDKWHPNEQVWDILSPLLIKELNL